MIFKNFYASLIRFFLINYTNSLNFFVDVEEKFLYNGNWRILLDTGEPIIGIRPKYILGGHLKK